MVLEVKRIEEIGDCHGGVFGIFCFEEMVGTFFGGMTQWNAI